MQAPLNMRKPVTISIVTPSYNQGSFLAETIESVIGQEGDFRIDYVIVDGASTDDSVEIIRQYAALLETGAWPVKCLGVSLRWKSEKDNGQTDALKKGFALAEGEILAWLCSDDVYLPGALQAIAGSFRDNPTASLLYGDAYYCDTEGAIIGRYPVEDLDLDRLAYFNFFCQPSTFFRREAFEAVGGLDESLNFAMDYDLFVRLVKRFSCQRLPRFLSKYRLHEASKTIRDDVLYENHEEALRLSLKYFDWAPLNVVYGSCNYYCLVRFPRFLTRSRIIVIFAALVCMVFRSLRLNRGVRKNDLRLLTFNNFRKLFKTRMQILTGNSGSR